MIILPSGTKVEKGEKRKHKHLGVVGGVEKHKKGAGDKTFEAIV